MKNTAATATRETANAKEPQIGETLAMREEDFGIEGITAEDRAYKGSRFCEVRDAVFSNPYQKVWGRPGEPPLPHYKAKESNIFRGLLSFGRHYLFGEASKRTSSPPSVSASKLLSTAMIDATPNFSSLHFTLPVFHSTQRN